MFVTGLVQGKDACGLPKNECFTIYMTVQVLHGLK